MPIPKTQNKNYNYNCNLAVCATCAISKAYHTQM